jgi:ABC-type multidrug transport system ATPase subunit
MVHRFAVVAVGGHNLRDFMITDKLNNDSHLETNQVDSPLVLQDLNKSYGGGVWANRDINLTMVPGEMLGILGPNGAGKTTLIRQITTELIPTSGKVTVLGHDAITEPIKVKSLLGIVPQEATLFDHLTAYQHLRIFAKLRGYPGNEAKLRAEELVTELQMDEYRNVPIRTLSGGLRRRLLIGIAALAQPPLMVLDEPTTGLDPESRRNLWALLRRYREAGTTVVITTHYMEEAEALCDRVGIIVGGRLLAVDTVDNLRISCGRSYKTTYTGNGKGREKEVLYGSNEEDVASRARALGISDFTISGTSLEDVYLALTGRNQGADDFTDRG